MSRDVTPVPGGQMVEVALLLPTAQLQALDLAACRRGLTAAQLLRRLIDDLARDASWTPASPAAS